MKAKGRSLSISPFRRLVADLMYFSARVPTVCMDRHMNLARVQAARNRCQPHPSWTAIFTKAHALTALRIPELRHNYLEFPWPRVYEFPYSVANVNLERQWGKETVVLQAQIRRPETRSLIELDNLIRYYKNEPVENIRCFKRIMGLARVPWPLRRFIFWAALNFVPRRRVHNFGTFGISTTAAYGAGIMQLLHITTSTLHYSMFDSSNALQMRLSFDHRVLDGATAATCLSTFEEILNTVILDELLGLRVTRAAA